MGRRLLKIIALITALICSVEVFGELKISEGEIVKRWGEMDRAGKSFESWGEMGRVVDQQNRSRKRKSPTKRNPSKKSPVKSTTKKNNGGNTSGSKNSTNVRKNNGATTKPKSSAEAKAQEAATKKEIQQTEAQIRENEAKVSKSLNELGKLDQEISLTNKKIGELNSRISKLNGEISGLEAGISTNEAELERLRGEYLKAVKKMRVTRKNKSTLAFIFSSKSLSQAMRRMRYLREFSKWRERQTEDITAKTIDLRNQKEALSKAKNELKEALALQQSNKKKLSTQHEQQEVLVADLKKNGAALQSHLKRKQVEAKELNSIVSRLIAEEQRKAAEEEERRKAAEEEARRKAEEERQRVEEEQQNLMAANKQEKNQNNTDKNKEKGKAPTEYADARKRKPRGKVEAISKESNKKESKSKRGVGSFADMKGKLSYPTTGSFTVTSRFGRQHLPDLPDVEYDNPGIDAETDAGASARAVYAGKVSGVYLLPGYNTVVIVNHGNYYTVYGNISGPAVKTGDTVEIGRSLGTLALNDDDKNHSSIHFEVWRNREKLNPQEWLK